MANPGLDPDTMLETLRLVSSHETITAAAAEAGINVNTFRTRVKRSQAWAQNRLDQDKGFETPDLPPEIAPVSELLARREREWDRRDAALTARSLIPITVTEDGPIGIAHLGDPHLDDPGMNIRLLRRHLDAIKGTRGLLAGNVGDTTNNWIGRLARLYAEQSTTAGEAWALAEWLFEEIPWLYVVGGNHDVWHGEHDILKWIAKFSGTLYEWHGARLELRLPGGRTCRVNARHDFSGHSQWNTAHGVGKAVQMGWRDHVLTCGHRHVSGYQILKDPATGLISHAIRCGTYKQWDSYAKAKGLPNQNAFPACVTVIDPDQPEDSTRFVTTILDVEEGAEFLRWKRKRAKVPV